MRILSRYFVARFLKYFVAILFSSMLAIATVEMLLNFDDMLKYGEGVKGILTYLGLRIPSYYLRELVPIACFAAAFVSFGLAAKWMEWTSAKAGGISPYRLIAPIFLAATLIAAITFAIGETIVVQANQRWAKLDRGDDISVSFQQGSFWYNSGHTIYNIKEANPDTRVLQGVRIYQRDRSGKLVSSLHANRVQIEDSHHWFMEEATVYHFDPSDDTRPARTVHHTGLRRLVANESEAALVAADASLLSLRTIQSYIEAKPSPMRVRRLEADLHGRLTEPFVTILFVMLAIPLGLRVEVTRSLGMPAISGLVTIGTFYMLRGTGVTLAGGGVAPAALAPWMLLGLFGLWSAFGLLRMPR